MKLVFLLYPSNPLHHDTGVASDTLIGIVSLLCSLTHFVALTVSVWSNGGAITHRPRLSCLLAHGARNSAALHLALGVDNDTRVVLKVQEDAVGALPRLALSHDNGGHDLLAQLGLSLLDRGHDHVADTGGRQAVQACANGLDGDDVQVAGAGVVCAVHDGAAAEIVSLFCCCTSYSWSQGRACWCVWEISIGVEDCEYVHRQTESHLQLRTGTTASAEVC